MNRVQDPLSRQDDRMLCLDEDLHSGIYVVRVAS